MQQLEDRTRENVDVHPVMTWDLRFLMQYASGPSSVRADLEAYSEQYLPSEASQAAELSCVHQDVRQHLKATSQTLHAVDRHRAQRRDTIKIRKALAVSLILHSDAGRHDNTGTKSGPAQAAQS